MSENKYGLTDLTNEAMVKEIRRKFLLEAETNPVLYHPIDVQRCRTEDWQIERFLLEKGTPDEALKELIRIMKWKNTFGIHDRNQTYFPRELPLIFGHIMLSRDRGGLLCVWNDLGIYKKIPDFDKLIRQYTAFRMDLVDREAGNQGIFSISDAKGLVLSNLDMSFMRSGSDISNKYPQYNLKKAITLDLPWFFMSTWRLLKTILPKSIADKQAIIKREQLLDYIDIDLDELPVSFGGNRETVYMNDDMLSLRQCKHLDFTDKQIDNFFKVYKSLNQLN